MSTNQDGTLAQQMFGSQAPVFAASRVHISDDSLEGIARLASTGPYGWTVDLGTGAGFTAFAMSDRSHRVVASDLTLPMLQQARRIGQERSLSNLLLSQNAAEHLPFADNSLDLVTCRVAGHHFADLPQALTEIRRVLKPGGALVMADTVSPENDESNAWLNDVELRRDFSHVNDRKISVIEELLSQRQPGNRGPGRRPGLSAIQQLGGAHRHARRRSPSPSARFPRSQRPGQKRL